MITNETIIKAAKAAGLDVRGPHPTIFSKSLDWPFDPLHNDSDNAMIRRDAEIVVSYWTGHEPVVHAHCAAFGVYVNTPVNNSDKAQAEREAVILCAAAKFDAMNEGVE